MIFIARWGPKGFTVSPSLIVPFNGFSTSLSLKADSENDTSGTAPSNTRGRELRPINFETVYVAAAGVDPRDQVAQWEAQLGNSYPLYIGEKRFGPPKMKLTNVAVSDVQFTSTGQWISCKVALTLEEYSEGKTSALTTKTTSSSSSSSSKSKSSSSKSGSSAAAKKATADYKAMLAAKKEAMNATASKSDKAQKKTSKGA